MRTFLKTSAVFLFCAVTLFFNAFAAGDIILPAPTKTGGKPLMEALNERSSARAFAQKELSLELLSNMLWAADGINRPETDKRTAPSAMNRQDIDVYVVLHSGIYLYSPKDNNLLLKKEGDFMKLAGKQSFVDSAAVNLVYVSNIDKFKDTKANDATLYAGVDAGCIAQNVYLFCASEGLNTVIRRMIDFEKLAPVLGLTEKQTIVLSQSVGYKP